MHSSNSSDHAPAPDAGAGHARGIPVGFRLVIPCVSGTERAFPLHNHVGASLLALSIRSEAAARGAPGARAAVVGGLNDALGLVLARDRSRGVQAVLQCLRQIGLLPFAEVAWYDRAELCWRTVHPQPARAPFERHFEAGRHEELLEETERAVAQAQDRICRYLSNSSIPNSDSRPATS